MKPALILIDLQRQFRDQLGADPSLSHAIEIINFVSGLFRAAGAPVIHLLDREDCRPGDTGFALIEGVERQPSDLEVHKVHSNGFRDSELGDLLDAARVDFLLLAGFRAEGCVLSTAMGAEDLDWAYGLLRGAILSPTPGAAAFVERIKPLLSYDIVPALLPQEGAPSTTRCT